MNGRVTDPQASISCRPKTDTTIANIDWSGDKLVGEKSRRNSAKTLRATFFFNLVIEASTAFRLLTPLQSVPIVTALQSVGEFSRVFSKAPTRTVFANQS
jgi:hypothetical protein